MVIGDYLRSMIIIWWLFESDYLELFDSDYLELFDSDYLISIWIIWLVYELFDNYLKWIIW